MTSKVDRSSLIKQSGNMVSSYFQNTKRAQASYGNTTLEEEKLQHEEENFFQAIQCEEI